MLPIIWEKFHENVLILGAGGQIARHVINQLADKQTIKHKLYLLISQQKSTNPIQLIARLLPGDVESCSTKQPCRDRDVVYANLTGEDLDIQANSVIAAHEKPVMLNV